MLPFIKEAVTQLFSKPSTEKYPAVDAPAPEGYRGRIVFHADRCISCGMCVEICPEVFHMGDDGLADVHQNPVPDEAEKGAVTAQESCPVSVIHVE